MRRERIKTLLKRFSPEVTVTRATRRKARRLVQRALRRQFPSNHAFKTALADISDETPKQIDLQTLVKEYSQDELQTKLQSSLCRESFYEFFKTMWHVIIPETFKDNWHIKYICDQMQFVAERVFRGERRLHDLVINISPGTSKSTICSVMFPAWVWTRMPSARTLCCSFSEKLSLRLSRYCRDVVKSDLYKRLFPEVIIKADHDTKGEFATTFNGVRFAIGSGTQVMGSHAHFIVVDDPIDPKGVLSELELARINNWIDEQLSGRKVDKGMSVTVMVAQRLHQDDPPARMGAKRDVKWIRIPATDEYDISPKGLRKHYIDGLMDPDRLTRKDLETVKQGPRGDYILAGQYGQNPVPPGGGMFKTGKITLIPPHVKPPRFKALVRFWDKAGTQGGGAYTVGVLMGLTPENRLYILDVIRVQLDSYGREKLIRQTARLDGKHVLVGIEQSGAEGGKESAENTQRTLAMRGHRCKALRPKGKKEDRAEPFSVMVNSGSVYVYNRDWAKTYIAELNYFPYGTFKDQVDATSGALTLLSRGNRRVGGMRRGMTDYKSKSRLVRGKTHRIYTYS